MRKPSRISPAYVAAQNTKRTEIKDTPGGSNNSVTSLRDRVTKLEEVLSLRVHNT